MSRVILVAALAIPLAAAAPEAEHPHHHVRHHAHHATRHTRHATEHRAPSPARTVAAPPPPVPAKPAPPPKPPVGAVTGLPLPRFASLRSDEVNLRSGPGTRYPIQWVYKRRDLPVEIEREYDVWRLVRMHDGTEGWLHQATLIGDRTFITLAASDPAGADLATAQAVRATPAANAASVAYLKPGVIGRVLSCTAGSEWCRVDVHGTEGYLPRAAMWGLLPGEAITSR